MNKGLVAFVVLGILGAALFYLDRTPTSSRADPVRTPSRREPATAASASSEIVSVKKGATIDDIIGRVRSPGRYTLRSEGEGSGDGGARLELVSYSGITTAEINQQLDYMSIDVKSFNAEIEALASKDEVSPSDLVVIAEMRRRIATTEVNRRMIVAGSYFVLRNGGLEVINRFLKKHDPDSHPYYILVERNAIRSSGNVSIVFAIDTRSDPVLREARITELSFKRDRRVAIADAFNKKPSEERWRAYRELLRLRALIRTSPANARHELKLKMQRIEPLGTRLDKNTYRLLPR